MSCRLINLLIVAGARPNFMKVAPLIKTIGLQENSSSNGKVRFRCRLVHTGQHYDTAMSDVFFGELGIREARINLKAGSGSHAVQTAKMMARFDPVCQRECPDWVVVVGDVNSTMACTLVCAKRGIRVAHVEAGLRSFDRSMPEEVNRIVTDALADLLFTPSPDADENLKREGIADEKIRLVGNIMIDALIDNLDAARRRDTLKRLGLRDRGYAYVTLHRPSNVDSKESLGEIMAELICLSKHMAVVFPMHPRTRKMLSRFAISTAKSAALKILNPIGYHDSLCLTERARFVLTDSGGLQEESTFFRTPCLTLRPNTERPITLTLGSNRLTSLPQLRPDIEQILQGPERTGVVPPLWDGHTAKRIVQEITTVSAK